MIPEVKADIARALRNQLGQAEDNLARANAAAKRNPRNEQWGQVEELR